MVISINGNVNKLSPVNNDYNLVGILDINLINNLGINFKLNIV